MLCTVSVRTIHIHFSLRSLKTVNCQTTKVKESSELLRYLQQTEFVVIPGENGKKKLLQVRYQCEMLPHWLDE